jgi:hypothetical protein
VETVRCASSVVTGNVKAFGEGRKLMQWFFKRKKCKRLGNPHELRWSRRVELPSKRESEIDRGSRNRSYIGHSQVTHSMQALSHVNILRVYLQFVECLQQVFVAQTDLKITCLKSGVYKFWAQATVASENL